ncbi:helix-turn-helix domain-containing protein [Litorimonas sp. RW-G-Af-16]|uniref:helix-turn-helix domain-containing protein n=1 Tax=Litorimonas sp. RW-G-Af-16 TaxID=3241168 RepID=UPI00390CCBBB
MELMMKITSPQNGLVEPYSTIKEAAKSLGLKPWALRKAVKDDLIPAYKFIGNRWMVKISEVGAAITTFNQGGDNV